MADVFKVSLPNTQRGNYQREHAQLCDSAPFHLWAGRFIGLVITDAKRALNQTLPTLINKVRKFVVRPGVLSLKGNELWGALAPFAACQALTARIQQLNHQRIAIPWLGHLILQVEIAPLPVGLAANPRVVRRRIFANRQSSLVT